MPGCGVWIDAPRQEMRDEFPVEAVDMIDQPTLDETGQTVLDIEVLGPLPEPFELFAETTVFHHMGFGIGERKQSHQTFFHRKMNPGLHGEFGKDGVDRERVVLVGRRPQAFQQGIELTVLQVDFGDADLEGAGFCIGAFVGHNRAVQTGRCAILTPCLIEYPRRADQVLHIPGLACPKRRRYSRGPLPVHAAKAR